MALLYTTASRQGPECAEYWAPYPKLELLLCLPIFSHTRTTFHQRKSGMENGSPQVRTYLSSGSSGLIQVTARQHHACSHDLPWQLQVRAYLSFLLDHQHLPKSHPVNRVLAIMTFPGNYSFASLLNCFIQQWFCSSMKHCWLDFQHCCTWGPLYRAASTQSMWESPFSGFSIHIWKENRRTKILFYKKSQKGIFKCLIFFVCLKTKLLF